MKKIKITAVESIKMENNELEAEFNGDAIIIENEASIHLGELRFHDRSLEQSEIRYKILLIKRSIFPDELLNDLPRLGNRVAVVDYKTGMKVYGRIDNRQYRITGLNSIWKKYPALKAGDNIRMAIHPVSRNIIIDFSHREDKFKGA